MTFTVKGRSYLDNGVAVPSVTTILGEAWPINLKNWAAKLVAGYAVDHWDELTSLTASARLRELEKVVDQRSKAAMLRGTQIHSAGETLLMTGEADVAPEHLGPVTAYARFLEDFDVQPSITERPILNRGHHYAGRPDLLAWVRGVLWLLDLKTGENVYDSAALQLAAYGHAEIYLNADGEETEWPHPERYGVIHIRPDTVDLLPVDVTPRTLRTFLYAAENARYIRESKQAWKDGRAWPVGEPMRPQEQTALKVVR